MNRPRGKPANVNKAWNRLGSAYIGTHLTHRVHCRTKPRHPASPSIHPSHELDLNNYQPCPDEFHGPAGGQRPAGNGTGVGCRAGPFFATRMVVPTVPMSSETNCGRRLASGACMQAGEWIPISETHHLTCCCCCLAGEPRNQQDGTIALALHTALVV